MFTKIEVIPYRYWFHAATGRKSSIYGAGPVWGDPESQGWAIVEKGYTWRCIDHRGTETVGLCRKPVSTKAEAEAVKQKVLSL